MSSFIPVEVLASLSSQAQAMVSGADAQPMQAVGVAAPQDLGAGSFGQMVSAGISQVNSQLIGSQIGLQQLAVGDAQNLHQVMINLEESRLSFQLMMQVRSRLLEAYQDVMKMPI